MIDKNYHTHTYRCGHASGSDEEYVLEAINMGLTVLGFSDHIMLKDHEQPRVRGNYSMLNDYISSLEALKEKYKDKIEIILGFEAEAMEYYFPYYKSLLDEGHIKYLILGNHCEIDENNKLHAFFSKNTKSKDIIRYTSSMIKGMKTKMFKIVAHPDYFMSSYHKWNKTVINCSERICKTAKELGIYLEFNFGAIRQGKRMIDNEYRFKYPYDKFWEIAKKYDCKICLGLDAHRPKDLSNELNNPGYEMVKELGLKIDQNIDFDKQKHNC
ncbi:MAG: histidinol-phosphatase [Gammaproteobacteria bacterium]|nr:histidinol-phosphatase [Gammaproteobacteria bacterium]